MDERDKFALVTFSSSSSLIYGLTQITKNNKNVIINKINYLIADDDTNIYSGLESGLSLLKENYISGEKIASIILLSDGIDNYNYNLVDDKFKQLLNTNKKSDYAFTLHTFGYGLDHDAVLMYDISKIKDGGYFAIEKLSDVKEAFLKIYGYLSTICNVNIQLIIQSDFVIKKIYGIEDMYEATLSQNYDNLFIFNVKLIQVVYGKKYHFVILVDVPEDITYGKKVLNIAISPLGLNEVYSWNDKINTNAYEEYIRCICVEFFSNGYERAIEDNQFQGKEIIENGLSWIHNNYKGSKNWEGEFNRVLVYINDLNSFGKANLLSTIRELKTSKIGLHYSDGNSYQRKLIDQSHNLDISNLPIMTITEEIFLFITKNINYYYYYIKEGKGIINDLRFSGNGNSLIIYSDNDNDIINIKPESRNMELYYWNETKLRIQTISDFSHPGKFIFKKDFPFDFYSYVDGRKDITFSINFLKLASNKEPNEIYHSIEIIGYIFDDSEIKSLENDINYLPSTKQFKGYYNSKLKLGKLVIKKEEIYNCLKIDSHNSYLYIIIRNLNKEIVYNNVEGQFLFISMDYIYSPIPEDFYIFSHLENGQKTPHLYTIKMTKENDVLIEFDTLKNGLACKILNHKNYLEQKSDLYIDYDKYIIKRNIKNNKEYIKILQSKDENEIIDNIILSIFPNNEDHIVGPNINNLSYIIKYIYFNETSANVTLLGFARFIYIKELKKINFFVYFYSKIKIVYSEILIFSVNILYKKTFIELERKNTEVECKLVDNYEFDKQTKYICSLEYNGEEIKNIEFNDDFDFLNSDIKITSKSSIVEEYLENLQKVGDTDIFENRKLYILENSTFVKVNKKNEFNITGVMNNIDFNYENLNLIVKIISNGGGDIKTKKIPCEIIKLNNEKTTLKCIYKEKGIISIAINDSFSQLEKDNLLVNLKDNENNIIDFESVNDTINEVIIAIVIISLIIIGLIIYLLTIILRRHQSKKDKKDSETKTHISGRIDNKSREKFNL